jgi:tRNA-dihydrouridine synthase
MAKVVRAFSIDPEVAQMIDRIAEKNQTWSKKSNKSKVVNQALRWYYLTDIAEVISELEGMVEFHRKRANGYASKQGVKHHLAGLLRYLNPFRPRKRVEQPKR